MISVDKPMIYYGLRIKEIRQELSDFKLFVLEDEDKAINAKAGQYLTFVDHDMSGEVRRSYSLCSSPLLNEPITIGVKRIPNGFYSRKLIDHARPGDRLVTIGAAGFFTLPDHIDKFDKLVFFAAGSGITPVISLIKTALYQYPEMQLILFYSNHSAGNVIFKKELLAIEANYRGRLAIEFLYSDHQLLQKARLYKELINIFLERYIGDELSSALFYICGPDPYMLMCTLALQEAFVPKNHIKKEIFNTALPAVEDSEPPDTQKRHIRIRFKNQQFQFDCQYPQTILKAAKEHGILLPYSCQVGKCGSCAAHCLKGEVWMYNNEILTDEETSKGMALLCTGYPIKGDLELEVP